MNTTNHASQSALQIILETYQQRVGNLWHNRQGRVVGFAGAALLSLLKEKNSPVQQHLRNLLLCTAKTLLSWSCHSPGNANQILLQANAGDFNSPTIPYPDTEGEKWI